MSITYQLEEGQPELVAGEWCEGSRCGQRRSTTAATTTRDIALGMGGASGAGIPANGLSGGVSEQMVYSLSLKQGHYYRLLASATNGVGLETGSPCPTPWVLVDTTPPTAGSVTLVQSPDDLAAYTASY